MLKPFKDRYLLALFALALATPELPIMAQGAAGTAEAIPLGTNQTADMLPPGQAIAGATTTQPATQPGRAARGRGRGAGGPPPPTPTLGLDSGTIDLDTPDFTLKLVKASQTIAALQPKGAKGFQNQPFDFTPADQLTARQGDRFNHLGDITFRIKQEGYREGAWIDFSSANARKPVNAIANPLAPNGLKVLASADLTPTIAGLRAPIPGEGRGGRGGGGGGGGGGGRGGAGTPADITDSPIQVTRSWCVDASNRLVLQFDLKNTSATPVTIGGLGFPVVFNNMINNFVTNRARSLPQAHEICTFADPYVGQDAGYLQVTRLSGHGPALLVVPANGTRSPFEAYRPLNDASPRGQTFEGAFEWTVHSQAYAENEWRNAQQWNPPTSETLAPGATKSYGIRFLVSDTIRNIEKTLADNNRPVAVGIPGYVLPMDLNAKLFLNTAGRKVTSVQAEPANALTFTPGPATKSGHAQYTINGKAWGRARLTVNYDDGSNQAIHYYVIKPAQQAVADLGNFLYTKHWYTKSDDPFKRAPSIMTYDRQNNRIVEQDTRVWIAGLQDEGGAGAWIAGAMKIFGQPKKEEVDKFAEFVDKTVWGNMQYAEGPLKYGVKKSLFFYDPQVLPDFKYQEGFRQITNQNGELVPASWTMWNKRDADRVDRAYNYPHVVAAYWSMYRLARNHPGLVTARTWDWYLDQAFNTVKFLTGGFLQPGQRPQVAYLDTGLMEGDIFVMLLQDLKREGKTEEAAYVERAMKRRADEWKEREYPFGSEMAWDSTGQEEVYAWTKYFGYHDKATVSLDSILGYMPTVPHWGYNGNARRYWDFFYGAAPGGTTERQIHHYGSGINAIPALTQFRENPDDLYLLRIGMGGTMGAISNIDQEGFAGTAFHSFPQNLRWDHYSGDYGPNFFGHAVNTGTYIINHPEYGWQSFGGNVTESNNTITVKPLDSFRRRLYIAPLGLFLTLDAGQFDTVVIQGNTVRVTLAPADPFTPAARLRIEQPAKVANVGAFAPPANATQERGAFVIPLQQAATTIELTAK